MDLFRVDETCQRPRSVLLFLALIISRYSETCFIWIIVRFIQKLDLRSLCILIMLLLQLIIDTLLKYILLIPRPKNSCIPGNYAFPSTHIQCSFFIATIYSYLILKNIQQRPSSKQYKCMKLYNCLLYFIGSFLVIWSRVYLEHIDQESALYSALIGILYTMIIIIILKIIERISSKQKEVLIGEKFNINHLKNAHID